MSARNPTEFLLARIAEREVVAQAANECGMVNDCTDPAHAWYRIGELKERFSDARRVNADAEHIALNDPAYILAECAAKRRIVADCRVLALAPDPYYASFANSALASLAAVYSDHPDYDEEWKP